MESEVRIMNSCKSEHIIKCFDLIQNQKWRVLVLQYCEQGTLCDKIYKEGKLEEKETIEIMAQMMLGFAVVFLIYLGSS